MMKPYDAQARASDAHLSVPSNRRALGGSSDRDQLASAADRSVEAERRGSSVVDATNCCPRVAEVRCARPLREKSGHDTRRRCSSQWPGTSETAAGNATRTARTIITSLGAMKTSVLSSPEVDTRTFLRASRLHADFIVHWHAHLFR